MCDCISLNKSCLSSQLIYCVWAYEKRACPGTSGIRGFGWKTLSFCCLIFVYRCDQNNNSKRNLCKPRKRVKLALCTCHNALHTHALFLLVLQETVSVILKGFHFPLSKYQERKMILLSQHFLSRLSPELRRESSEILSGENKQ